MLDKPVDEIVVDSETGKFVGVRSGEETVKADMVIGDPSYFRSGVAGKDKVRETGKVVRAICIQAPYPQHRQLGFGPAYHSSEPGWPQARYLHLGCLERTEHRC